LGLAIGSFLNVIICRLKTKENFFLSRSHCPHCKKTLKWFDLIPVLSFISTFGKCRYCHKKISWQYPLVEIITGGLFLLIFNFSAFGGSAVGGQFFNLQTSNFSFLNFFLLLTAYFLLLFILCSLIVIFVYDLKHYIIPDKIIYPAIIVALIFNFQFSIFNFQTLFYAIFSAIIASGFFFLIILISKGAWMGFGDVKLAFLIGLILGWPDIIFALFLAFILGAVIGLILIGLKIKSMKSQIPFGPFLVAATIIMMLWGEIIKGIYFSLIF
jgi:prepilin signal peptidase PulO-like enzyme (type II secretory pathway)